ncbi:MAG: hypothetical protein ACJATA_000710 [Sphingobacteriales bacterium]|jgi:hypothetical protein
MQHEFKRLNLSQTYQIEALLKAGLNQSSIANNFKVKTYFTRPYTSQ